MRPREAFRPHERLVTASVALFILALLPGVAAAAQRGHMVSQIVRDGRPVALAAATLTFRDGHVEHSIRRGESIPDGTRIEVPAREEVILTSTGGKSTTTLGPNTSFTPMQTAAGETSSLDRGVAWFSVVRGALDFFQVNHTQRFNASVKGTKFRIDATGPNVGFDCTDGSVAVTQVGTALVGSARVKQISKVEYLSAAGRHQASYPSFIRYLSTFANFAQAKAAFQQQLARAEATGDPAGISAGLSNLGLVEDYLGEYADARRTHLRALALYRQAGNHDGEARALNNLGTVEASSGRYGAALQLHEQSLSIYRQLGNRSGEAAALTNIGFVGRLLCRYDEALANEQQALALNRQLGDAVEEAGDLVNIGNVQYNRGHYDEARASYEAALATYRQFGDRDGEGRALSDAGAVSYQLKHYAEALTAFQAAYSIFYQLGDREGIGATLNNIGISLSGLGRYDEALSSFSQSLTVRHRLGDWRNEAGVYAGISDTEILMKQPAAALEDAKRGLALDPKRLWLTLKLAHAYLYGGNFPKARALYLLNRDKRFETSGSCDSDAAPRSARLAYGQNADTFRKAALRDFARYRAAGIDTPDVARMEALLKPAPR